MNLFSKSSVSSGGVDSEGSAESTVLVGVASSSGGGVEAAVRRAYYMDQHH